jgi:hypothetical protein
MSGPNSKRTDVIYPSTLRLCREIAKPDFRPPYK